MPIWRINEWSGGLSTATKHGVDGSFIQGKNLDFKTDPDLLQANIATVKQSSTNVTDLIRWFAQDSTTASLFYGYGDSGKIYSSANSWTSLRSVASSKGQGLAVFNDYLYYTQNAQLGRYGPLSGVPTFNDAYQTLNSDVNWHPMKVFLDKLVVGNGQSIATLSSGGIWTASVIKIETNWNVKCLEVKGDFIYIGAWRGGATGAAITDYEQGKLYSWDGITTTSWNSLENFNEAGVNALVNQNDNLFIFAGTRGNIYQFYYGRFIKIKKIPAVGIGKVVEVFPGAVTLFNGQIHFGLSGSAGTSTTALQGVYTWGQAEKNYPMVLNFDYSISTGTTTGTGMNIGAVYGASPTKLLIGWKDGTSYGVDLVDTAAGTASSTGVTYNSLIYDADAPYSPKLWKEIRLSFIPNGGTITVGYDLDRTGSFTTLTDFTELFDTTTYDIRPMVKSIANSNLFPRSNELQLQITLNSGAQLIECAVLYDIEER